VVLESGFGCRVAGPTEPEASATDKRNPALTLPDRFAIPRLKPLRYQIGMLREVGRVSRLAQCKPDDPGESSTWASAHGKLVPPVGRVSRLAPCKPNDPEESSYGDQPDVTIHPDSV
jgi:hypothetical protein